MYVCVVQSTEKLYLKNSSTACLSAKSSLLIIDLSVNSFPRVECCELHMFSSFTSIALRWSMFIWVNRYFKVQPCSSAPPFPPHNFLSLFYQHPPKRTDPRRVFRLSESKIPGRLFHIFFQVGKRSPNVFRRIEL